MKLVLMKNCFFQFFISLLVSASSRKIKFPPIIFSDSCQHHPDSAFLCQIYILPEQNKSPTSYRIIFFLIYKAVPWIYMSA